MNISSTCYFQPFLLNLLLQSRRPCSLYQSDNTSSRANANDSQLCCLHELQHNLFICREKQTEIKRKNKRKRTSLITALCKLSFRAHICFHLRFKDTYLHISVFRSRKPHQERLFSHFSNPGTNPAQGGWSFLEFCLWLDHCLKYQWLNPHHKGIHSGCVQSKSGSAGHLDLFQDGKRSLNLLAWSFKVRLIKISKKYSHWITGGNAH